MFTVAEFSNINNTSMMIYGKIYENCTFVKYEQNNFVHIKVALEIPPKDGEAYIYFKLPLGDYAMNPYNSVSANNYKHYWMTVEQLFNIKNNNTDNNIDEVKNEILDSIKKNVVDVNNNIDNIKKVSKIINSKKKSFKDFANNSNNVAKKVTSSKNAAFMVNFFNELNSIATIPQRIKDDLATTDKMIVEYSEKFLVEDDKERFYHIRGLAEPFFLSGWNMYNHTLSFSSLHTNNTAKVSLKEIANSRYVIISKWDPEKGNHANNTKSNNDCTHNCENCNCEENNNSVEFMTFDEFLKYIHDNYSTELKDIEKELKNTKNAKNNEELNPLIDYVNSLFNEWR